MTDPNNPLPGALASAGVTISGILSELLHDLEAGAAAVIIGVMAMFMPQLLTISLRGLGVIGNNFRDFLNAIGTGTKIGVALADMLTADWNEVTADEQKIAVAFATAVGTAFDKLGWAES